MMIVWTPNRAPVSRSTRS